LHIVVLVDAGVPEKRQETIAVEAAVGGPECRVLGNELRHAIVRNPEVPAPRFVIDSGVEQQPVQHLLRIDLTAGALRLLLHPGEFRDGDLFVPDGRERAGAVALELARDAPDREARDKEQQQPFASQLFAP
jgi:hypothetical protein